MFHRLIVEDWQRVLSISSFTVFAFVFLLTLARTFHMRRDHVRHLENLPLTNDRDEKSH